MKIRMLVSMAGADFALSVGDETERFSKSEAIRMIEAGYAVPALADEIETTDAHPAQETRRRGRPRKDD
ncbi:MAG TPA: hypothetical protein VNQ56_12895 [Pseudolabrys sp.]|nr:hypothetical protein [Pseudolabrys sp.]